jgi:hypothetical protein
MTDFSTKISNFTTQFNHVFFPQVIPESTPITMKDALSLLDTQRMARITKSALFALSSFAATVTLVLTQGAVISWPLVIPSILITVVTGLIFYRLNSHDEKYIERLNEETRQTLVKKELETIFLRKNAFEVKNIPQSLQNINRLLQCDIFSENDINNILNIQFCALDAKSTKPLAEFALEQNKPIIISSRFEWFSQGRFGLSSYDQIAQVSWNGDPEKKISVIYQSKTKEN